MDSWAQGFAYALLITIYINFLALLVFSLIINLLIKRVFKTLSNHLITIASVLIALIVFGIFSLPLPRLTFNPLNSVDVWFSFATFIALELINWVIEPIKLRSKITLFLLIIAWVIISPLIALKLYSAGFSP